MKTIGRRLKPDLKFPGFRFLLKPLTQILLAGSVVTASKSEAETFGYSLAFGGDYATNPKLESEAKDAVYSGLIKPKMWLQWQAPSRSLNVNAGLNLVESSNTDLINDRNDPNLSLTYSENRSRSALSTTANYRETSTLVSELYDTGKINSDETRIDSEASIDWQYQLAERSEIGLSGGLSDVKYSSDDFVSYQVGNLGTYLQHQASEQFSGQLALKAQLLSPEIDTAKTSELVGLLLNMRFQISENAASEFGVETIYTEGSENASDEIDWNGFFKISFLGKKTRYQAVYARETTPSGLGRFVTADSLKVNFSYLYSPKTEFNISASLRDVDSLERNRVSLLELQAKHRIMDRWSSRIAWQYKYLDRIEMAKANVISFSLNYSLVD
ncbi:hypothetical protein [Microbulbifer sp. ALW1]|uniref:hypothetical protein n=1 Tax=Microbulbifer sp. (strain ALW1) TaxID=1516059 RepID=UPI0013589EF2|nr:hypothetical protein [Microbulbifer sp. ALW1]